MPGRRLAAASRDLRCCTSSCSVDTRMGLDMRTLGDLTMKTGSSPLGESAEVVEELFCKHAGGLERAALRHTVHARTDAVTPASLGCALRVRAPWRSGRR